MNQLLTVLTRIGEGFGSTIYATTDDQIVRAAKNRQTQTCHRREAAVLDVLYQHITSVAIPTVNDVKDTTTMPDAIFADPTLANIYDLLDSPERPDLEPYVAMTDEFHAEVVIDLGCGTGELACRLAARGTTVIGIDPAAASLAVAKQKAHAGQVRWIVGTAAQLNGLQADLIVMVGNVAQVFTSDEEWAATLCACYATLRPGGRLVFEVRDPAQKAWDRWHREQTNHTVILPDGSIVESWTELQSIDLPLVSFQHTFVFSRDGRTLTSDSTLRFRSKAEITDDLARAGFTVEDSRDAPDRPGLEFVFVARR